VTRATVGLAKAAEAIYPAPPFHPSERFPEAPFDAVSGGANHVYPAVREALRLAGLDTSRFGSAGWNPFGHLIRPGQTVLLKPNFIRESDARDPTSWEHVITHGSVIRAVGDYVAKALQGQGRILIADSPEGRSKWDLIVERSGVGEVVEFYRREAGLTAELIDLRQEVYRERSGVPFERITTPGDPAGSVLVNLGEHSAFAGFDGHRFYGADYDVAETNRHHRGATHEYRFSASALLADAVIHIPKMKTHKKAGVTLSLKNLVGLNTYKNFLPHFSMGAPATGGDQYPEWTAKRMAEYAVIKMWKPLALRIPQLGRLGSFGKTAGEAAFGATSETIRSGNWHGNDTIWRMILDLARIASFAGADGTIGEEPRRATFSVVDGIVAGEGAGPEAPDPMACGLVVAGPPLESDLVAAFLMGFDYRRIPFLFHAVHDLHPLRLGVSDPGDVDVRSTVDHWDGALSEIDPDRTLRFRPHFGWAGHIELAARPTVRR